MSGEDRRLDPPAGGGPPRHRRAIGDDGEDSPLNQLAAAVRRIGAVAVGQPLDDDDVSAAAAKLAAVADRLEAAAAAREADPQPAHPPGAHPQDISRPAR